MIKKTKVDDFYKFYICIHLKNVYMVFLFFKSPLFSYFNKDLIGNK